MDYHAEINGLFIIRKLNLWREFKNEEIEIENLKQTNNKTLLGMRNN